MTDRTEFFAYPGEVPPPSSQRSEGRSPPSLGFLAALHDADWALLVGAAPVRRIPAGAVALGAGETDRALHVVLAGLLCESSGPAVEHGAGDFFGERCFLEETRAACPVVAVVDSLVLRLGLTEFEALAAREPQLGRFVLFDLARVLAARATP